MGPWERGSHVCTCVHVHTPCVLLGAQVSGIGHDIQLMTRSHYVRHIRYQTGRVGDFTVVEVLSSLRDLNDRWLIGSQCCMDDGSIEASVQKLLTLVRNLQVLTDAVFVHMARPTM